MSMEKRLRVRGTMMLVSFFIVLTIIFMPIFKGQNGLDFLDSLFNAISKGSAYYIPQNLEQIKAFQGKSVDLKIATADGAQAAQIVKLFQAAGVTATVSDKTLAVQGDLAAILKNSLEDADAMYANQGDKLVAKYGYGAREVTYNWWKALKEMDKKLTQQKLFAEAKMVATIKKKAVETAYNYYGIEPKEAKKSVVLIVLALTFYVFYTLWYGYSILYLFEGYGLKITH